MSSSILPSINTSDFEEANRRIKIAEEHTQWVHLDISDGTFTSNVSWHNPQDLKGLHYKTKLEVHLMVSNTEEILDDWFIPEVSRIVFHLEAVNDTLALIEKCKKAGKEVGIAICPNTPWETLLNYEKSVDLFQVLAVSPGPTGQIFSPSTIEKIARLYSRLPTVPIEVDGGVNPEIVRKCKKAGATLFVSGWFLFDSGKPFLSALKELEYALSA